MYEYSKPNMPKVTLVQILAGIPILAQLLHVFGVFDFNQEQQDAMTEVLTWAAALLGADAVIRFGRALMTGLAHHNQTINVPVPEITNQEKIEDGDDSNLPDATRLGTPATTTGNPVAFKSGEKPNV